MKFVTIRSLYYRFQLGFEVARLFSDLKSNRFKIQQWPVKFFFCNKVSPLIRCQQKCVNTILTKSMLFVIMFLYHNEIVYRYHFDGLLTRNFGSWRYFLFVGSNSVSAAAFTRRDNRRFVSQLKPCLFKVKHTSSAVIIKF